jgi:hypothetical protein
MVFADGWHTVGIDMLQTIVPFHPIFIRRQ